MLSERLEEVERRFGSSSLPFERGFRHAHRRFRLLKDTDKLDLILGLAVSLLEAASSQESVALPEYLQGVRQGVAEIESLALRPQDP